MVEKMLQVAVGDWIIGSRFGDLGQMHSRGKIVLGRLGRTTEALWSFEVRDALTSDLLLDVVVGTQVPGFRPIAVPLPQYRTVLFAVDNDLVSVAVPSGSVEYTRSLEFPIVSVHLWDSSIYLITCECGLTAIARETGAELWSFFRDVIESIRPSGEDGEVAVTFLEGKGIRVRLRDGALREA